MPPKGNPLSLKKFALKRVCQDIIRHFVKFTHEQDNALYLIFLRDHSDEILEIMRKHYDTQRKSRNRQNVSIFQIICPESCNVMFRDFLSFILNKFLRRIYLSHEEFNEEVSTIISRNCKELRSFALSNSSVVPEMMVPLLRNTGNLSSLSLIKCGHLNLEVIEAISTTLLHLKTLDLKGTKIPENGLYILCGHKLPFHDRTISGCSFTKCCGVTSPLKLHHINISGHIPEFPEAACVLTHIPTIKTFYPQLRFRLDRMLDRAGVFTLSKTVSKIISSQLVSGLSSSKFEIEKLGLVYDDVENWNVFFQHCPKLKCLEVTVDPNQPGLNQNMVEALAKNKLHQFTFFDLTFRSARDVLNESFRLFWKRKGHQLKQLNLNCNYGTISRFSSSCFAHVMEFCPNLEILTVCALLTQETEIAEHFPCLPNLRSLTLTLYGEVNIVCRFSYGLVLSCNNILSVRLTCSRGVGRHLYDTLKPLLTSHGRELVIMEKQW